jgi:hypothetical protein
MKNVSEKEPKIWTCAGILKQSMGARNQVGIGDQVSILSLAGRYETLFVVLARQAT